MLINTDKFTEIKKETESRNATLVAVSKIKPPEAIEAMYGMGHRDFGENYVQEMVDKQSKLPKDIRWHFIGHLQSNKVKYIAPFVHLIHGVDSEKLAREIAKQALKFNRIIPILLQVHVAQEETKFGMNEEEVESLLGSVKASNLKGIQIRGLMGMASYSDDQNTIRSEFRTLKGLFGKYQNAATENISMEILSMGMSGDYKLALEEGSNLIRIGSLLFGSRQKGQQ